MVETLADIAKRAADENQYVGDRMARLRRQEIEQMTAETPKLQRWLKTYQLAKAELHLGNESEAIRLMGEAVSLIRSNPNEIKPEFLKQFYFDVAVTYLRWGETQNCCRQHNAGSCIVPIQGDAIHQHQDGSRQGIQWLTALLQILDEDEPMQLATRWLLNLAHMTLGEYPHKVPEAFLIPNIGESTFPSDAVADASAFSEQGRWKNVASDSGVATFSLAGGAIADDFDNDGDIDLAVSNWDPRESLKLFWNDGAGKFTDGTSAAGLSKILGGLNMVQTDFNNDGHIDIFVMRGGWLASGGQHPNSLLRNNGDGTFTDVTINAGLALPKLPTQTAAWADYDLDGDLDVYVGNESTDDLKAASQLFRNNGDETFTDVAKEAGVTNMLLAKAVTWGDYDNDRYPDLYVSNYRGANRLYRNRGDGTFEDVAERLNVTGPSASFPTWFCDANQDGNLDLFVAAYSGGISEIAASMLSKDFDRQAALPRLYVGNGGKQFTNQAESMGLLQPTHPMGANFGDVNSDGYPDIFLGTGWPEYHELMPNLMYLNQLGNRFLDVTNVARVGHLQKGHAVAMADFDNDGDVDVFEQMGGFVPGDKFYDVLFQNPSPPGNWLKVKVIGTDSNHQGIGARIHVRVTQDGQPRSIYRWVQLGRKLRGKPIRATHWFGGSRNGGAGRGVLANDRKDNNCQPTINEPTP